MLTVYAIPISLYCAKLRILLRHKGLEWREVLPPGGYGADEYKETVPSGNLPALDDDGLVIGDSEAIAEYLEEKFPAPPMMPDGTSARARVRELSRFHDTRLEPELRKIFPHIRRDARDAGVAATQSLALSERLAQLARLLPNHDSVRSDTLTLADCGFPITFMWLDLLGEPMGLRVEWPGEVVTYRERLKRFDAVVNEMESYRGALAQWFLENAVS